MSISVPNLPLHTTFAHSTHLGHSRSFYIHPHPQPPCQSARMSHPPTMVYTQPTSVQPSHVQPSHVPQPVQPESTTEQQEQRQEQRQERPKEQVKKLKESCGTIMYYYGLDYQLSNPKWDIQVVLGSEYGHHLPFKGGREMKVLDNGETVLETSEETACRETFEESCGLENPDPSLLKLHYCHNTSRKRCKIGLWKCSPTFPEDFHKLRSKFSSSPNEITKKYGEKTKVVVFPLRFFILMNKINGLAGLKDISDLDGEPRHLAVDLLVKCPQLAYVHPISLALIKLMLDDLIAIRDSERANRRTVDRSTNTRRANKGRAVKQPQQAIISNEENHMSISRQIANTVVAQLQAQHPSKLQAIEEHSDIYPCSDLDDFVMVAGEQQTTDSHLDTGSKCDVESVGDESVGGESVGDEGVAGGVQTTCQEDPSDKQNQLKVQFTKKLHLLEQLLESLKKDADALARPNHAIA